MSEAAHRNPVEPDALLVLVFQQVAHQRGLDRPRTDRIAADTLRSELDRERFREGNDRALAGGIGILRYGAAHQSHEGGDVDDGTAARLDQLRDAVLAAEGQAL